MVLGVLGCVLLVGLHPAAAAAVRPNIIVIVADDLGYADVGFNGCREISTPNIDSLVRQGVRCSNGYVSHPFCSPTRAALLTGRYQQRFGHENNPVLDVNDTTIGLPTNQVTMAQLLQSAGYQTIAVGKWHLGGAPRFHPNARGFTDFFGFLAGDHVYFSAKLIPQNPNTLMRNHEPVAEPEYLTDAFSREAANYIQRLVQNQPGPPELYDLSVDISETKNIAKENGEVVRRLLQAHADWNAELISPLWAQAGAVPKNQGSPQSHPVGPAPAGSRIED